MQQLTCDLWLMERQAFRQFLSRESMAYSAGFRVDIEMAKAAAAATPRQQKSIAVLPIHGAMEARPSFLGQMFGMVSYEAIGNAFQSLLTNDAVSAIVLDCATPGGMVYGCSELANMIFQSRGKKPIIAVANPLAASGGYWLAAAADRVVVTPSGDVGSVGVISEHVDMSVAAANEGVKVTVIRSTNSPFKGETNDMEPLTDEAKANLKSRADSIYQTFAGDLSKFRGVSIDHVNAKFGQGRVVDANTAKSAGMVDRIDTLQSTLQKLMDGRIRLGGSSALDDWEMSTDMERLRERRMERVTALKNAATLTETATDAV